MPQTPQGLPVGPGSASSGCPLGDEEQNPCPRGRAESLQSPGGSPRPQGQFLSTRWPESVRVQMDSGPQTLGPIKLLSQTEQAQDRCQLPSPPSWPSPTRPTWDLRATVHVSGSISLPFPSCPTAHFSQTRPILWPGPPLTLQGPQGQHQNSRGSQGLCSTWTAHLVWKDQVRHLLPLLGAKLEPSSLYSALGRGLLLGGAVPSTAPPAPPTRTCSPLSGGLLRPGSGLLYTLVLSWGW